MALFERLYQQGNTIVLVTHERDIAEYAHRIVTIRDGKIHKDETREQHYGPRATELPLPE
jgi:putative ABC transport system ATP-binding protein